MIENIWYIMIRKEVLVIIPKFMIHITHRMSFGEKQHICKQQKVSLCLRSSFHKVQPGIFGGILTHCC